MSGRSAPPYLLPVSGATPMEQVARTVDDSRTLRHPLLFGPRHRLSFNSVWPVIGLVLAVLLATSLCKNFLRRVAVPGNWKRRLAASNDGDGGAVDARSKAVEAACESIMGFTLDSSSSPGRQTSTIHDAGDNTQAAGNGPQLDASLKQRAADVGYGGRQGLGTKVARTESSSSPSSDVDEGPSTSTGSKRLTANEGYGDQHGPRSKVTRTESSSTPSPDEGPSTSAGGTGSALRQRNRGDPMARHGLVRMRGVEPGVVRRRFSRSAAEAPRRTLSQLLRITNELLSRPLLNAGDVEALVSSCESLASYAVLNMTSSVQHHSPSAAARQLGRRFMLLNALWSASLVLGDSMPLGLWSSVVSAVSSAYNPGVFVGENSTLAVSLRNAINQYKRGSAPSNGEVFRLKQILVGDGWRVGHRNGWRSRRRHCPSRAAGA